MKSRTPPKIPSWLKPGAHVTAYFNNRPSHGNERIRGTVEAVTPRGGVLVRWAPGQTGSHWFYVENVYHNGGE